MKKLSSYLIILFFLSCTETKVSTLPFYNSTDYRPEWIPINSADYSKIHTIDPFNFTDHKGKKLDQAKMDGKVYVANFFFTSCPSICPKLTRAMEGLQNKFITQPDFQLLSHTVMPWKDSVDVLNLYAENMNVDYKRWKLVTGPEEEIYKLARESYFAEEQFGFTQDEDEFLHTDKFILVDRHRRIRGIYTGLIKEDLNRLAEDVEILLASKE